MKITKDALLLASAMGAGGGGGKGPSWPFVVPYEHFLSTDGGKLDTHDSVTGGLTPVKDQPNSTFSRSVLTNAGWESYTYSNSDAGRLEFGYRIDFTNISKLCLTMGRSGTYRLQYRADLSETWVSLEGTAVNNTYVFDTSGISGWKYIRLTDTVMYSSTVHTVTGIYVIPGPYLYRYGDEVTSLTGGWFMPPTIAPAAGCVVTKETDHISVDVIAKTSAHVNSFITRELIDLSNVAAIHLVASNSSLYLNPTFALYDDAYVAVYRGSYTGSQISSRPTVTDIRCVLPDANRGQYHVGMRGYNYSSVSAGYGMNFYGVYLEYLT